MTGSRTVRRTVALAAASVLTLWSAAPALADPGSGQGNGHGAGAHADHGQHRGQQHGQQHGQHQQKDPHQGAGHAGGTHGNSGSAPGHSGTHGNSGSAPGHSGTHGNSGSAPGHSGTHGNGGGHGAGHGDPAGNNGTVKIAPLGEIDRIPNNTPHPGCSFEVEWYGFDEGADVVSTVTFSAQAPTADAGISVDGPSHVFVGGDPATGAGTATGLDGRETYTLSFTGEPHPKQGYHVRLTVHTPHSLGNDTKTKVFWVAPCESGSDTGGGTTGGGTTGGGTDTTGDTTGGTASSDTEVLGEQATAPSSGHAGQPGQAGPAQAQARDTVPTAVDAGEHGRSTISELVRSPWPLAVVALGAVLTLVAAASRRRSGARADVSE